MLIALLISVFFITSGDILMAPNLDKFMKKAIVDDAKKKEGLNLWKEHKKIAKKQIKKNKKWNKKWRTLIMDYSTSHASFDSLQSQYFDDYGKYQQVSIANQIKFLSLITDEEWEQILQDIEEDEKKGQKKKNKVLKEVKSELKDLKKKMILDSMNDTEKEIVLELYQQLELATLKYLDTKANMNFSNNNQLRNKNITKEELQSFHDLNNEAVANLLDSFIKVHFGLKDILTAKEWKKFKKAVNKIFI